MHASSIHAMAVSQTDRNCPESAANKRKEQLMCVARSAAVIDKSKHFFYYDYRLSFCKTVWKEIVRSHRHRRQHQLTVREAVTFCQQLAVPLELVHPVERQFSTSRGSTPPRSHW